MTETRTKKAMKNTMFSMIGYSVSILMMFITRTVFIYTLHANYLGISGLFSNLLAILNLAELGIGTAVGYMLYRPLARGETDRLHALLEVYAKIYRAIGLSILAVGLMLSPFIEYMIHDHPDIPHLQWIFVIYLADSCINYFFARFSTILEVDQKVYFLETVETISEVVKNLLQIAVLLLTANFMIYLLIQIASTIVENIIIRRIARKEYAVLLTKRKTKLDPEDKRTLKKSIFAMGFHQIGDVAVNSTDMLLISAFSGVYWVGLYSNYLLIISTLNGLYRNVFDAVTASVGNLTAMESEEKIHGVFKTMFFFNSWLYGFSAVCFAVLVNPFITLWIGASYLLEEDMVYLIALIFFLNGMRQTVLTFRDTMGLFWHDRFKPLAEAAINLIFSIILLQTFGLIGVFMGTLISIVLTSFWVEPIVLFKKGLKMPVWPYFLSYLGHLSVILLIYLLVRYGLSLVPDTTWPMFFVKTFLCVGVVNALLLLVFGRTPEFRQIVRTVMRRFHKEG